VYKHIDDFIPAGGKAKQAVVPLAAWPALPCFSGWHLRITVFAR